MGIIKIKRRTTYRYIRKKNIMREVKKIYILSNK